MANKFRLPVPCSLREGESLPGFLSRATHENSYASMYSIANYFGLNVNGRNLSKNHMQQLAKGRVDLDVLASFTESEPERVRQAALRLSQPTPGTSSDDFISFQRWRFCPLCVRERRPHQRAWMLSFVTACPDHQCQLVDACHACGNEYSISHMLNRYCVSCQKPAEIIHASSEELKCAQVLSSHIDDKRELKKILDRLMLGWFLTNPHCLRPHYRISPQLKTVSEMREVVCRIWPNCKDESAFHLAISSYSKRVSTKWKYLPYLHTVFKEQAHAAGARIPKVAENNVATGFNLPVLTYWAPINESARSAGISAFMLKRLIRTGYVNTKHFSEKDADKKRHKFLMIDLDSLNDTFSKLLDGALPSDDQRGLTSIRQYPLDEIVRDAFAGKLTLRYGDNKTVSDLLVVNVDTAKARRKELKPEDALTSKQVAESVKTYHAVIVDLLKHGFLVKHDAYASGRLLITQHSLERFNSKYVVVGNIAQEYAVNATNLGEKLASIGIEPEPVDTLVKIYKRSKLKNINAETLQSISSYETKTGRKASYSTEGVSSNRVKKLIQLVDDHGGITAFTKKYGGSQGTLSLMLREKKTFGHLAVKRMEEKVDLPQGWFDS